MLVAPRVTGCYSRFVLLCCQRQFSGSEFLQLFRLAESIESPLMYTIPCVPNREYCQQKTKKCSSATMVEIIFMFSFGVAHSDDPFSDCKAVSKGKQTLV